MRLQDAVAVVTGGTGTMGAEIAATLIKHGATVVKWDLGPAAPGVLQCDVSDAASVAAAFTETVRDYGIPTVLVNAAGVSGGRAPWAERVKRWTPIGNRLAKSSDVADAVLALLLSDFVTGQVVVVDGGLSLRSLTQPA